LTASALLVAVPEAEAAVAIHRIRHDPSAAGGVPAHVTVLYPFLVGPALDRAEPELGGLFARHEAFSFRLGRVQRFPQVVWLAPEPDRPFRDLIAAVATRWPEAPPYEGIHDEVIPHLTVAQTDDESVLAVVVADVAGHLPIDARADRVLLMEEDDGVWRTRAVFPLGMPAD
jgi:2'-5' RNA ligase